MRLGVCEACMSELCAHMSARGLVSWGWTLPGSAGCCGVNAPCRAGRRTAAVTKNPFPFLQQPTGAPVLVAAVAPQHGWAAVRLAPCSGARSHQAPPTPCVPPCHGCGDGTKWSRAGAGDTVRLRSTRWQAETSLLVALVSWRCEGGGGPRGGLLCSCCPGIPAGHFGLHGEGAVITSQFFLQYLVQPKTKATSLLCCPSFAAVPETSSSFGSRQCLCAVSQVWVGSDLQSLSLLAPPGNGVLPLWPYRALRCLQAWHCHGDHGHHLTVCRDVVLCCLQAEAVLGPPWRGWDPPQGRPVAMVGLAERKQLAVKQPVLGSEAAPQLRSTPPGLSVPCGVHVS